MAVRICNNCSFLILNLRLFVVLAVSLLLVFLRGPVRLKCVALVKSISLAVSVFVLAASLAQEVAEIRHALESVSEAVFALGD